MAIIKSKGLSSTEKVLAELCEKTFLKLWSYPNLYKSDGKEVCDLLAIFENHVFLFFDRESKKFEDPEQDILLQWKRWQKEVIQKQITTAAGAKKYILAGGKLFIDQKNLTAFPIPIPKNPIIHKIIVAHGAKEACKNFSDANVSGSLAIGYSNKDTEGITFPFMLHLDKRDSVHVFDSQNLEIILEELDTVHDFTAYIIAKEEAIRQYDDIFYCGEEDLLAHYFRNYDQSKNRYFIGAKRADVNGIFIAEGEWMSLIQSAPYKLRKEANSSFQIWDDLIQRTGQNALDGIVKGNGNVFNSQSAIYEMAKEPRFFRRVLSETMIAAIKNFPENIPGLARNISFMPSFYKDKAYVFLQVKHPNIVDYDNDYRPKRQAMLELACGAAKNNYPYLNKVIGIGIDAPKFSESNAEDFILLDCKEWLEEDRKYYENANKGFNFFNSNTMQAQVKTVKDFPTPDKPPKKIKIGRNDKCTCGSGKKYKKCCG
jgi:hypothetical protein